MLKWRQVQLIVDRLLDQERVPVPPEVLDEPWRTVYRRVRPPANLGQAGWELWAAAGNMEEEEKALLVKTVLSLLPSGAELALDSRYPSLRKQAEHLSPVEWLWPGWIPRGMLSLLGAAPGAGKSLLALDLARRLIHGRHLPDGGSLGMDAGRPVVYVDGEAVPQILNARAENWGMDRDRLYLMLPDERCGLIDFGADAEQARLTQMCHDLQPCLLVVDSLGAVSAHGENSVEDVREILSFLGAVAREFDLALLLIHHLRKKGNLVPRTDLISIDDFRGSSHIVAIARSVLALSVIQTGPQLDRNGPRRLEVVKTNMGRYPPPLGVLFHTVSGSTKGEGQVPRLRYVDPPRPYQPPTQTDECAVWLVKLLKETGEPLKPREVLVAGREAGFTRATVYRARQKLGDAIVEVGSGPRDPQKTWELEAGGRTDHEGLGDSG